MARNGLTEPQVMVIGLDGASWNVLNLMMSAGAMPNLKDLVNTGVSGSLRSTIPPTSPPAWTSFMTGKNPGKHGVFSWGEAVNLRFDPVNALSIHGKTLWQLLGEYGKRIGVFNVPITYPLRTHPINGFFIAGFLTPSVESEFTYPAGLRNELLSLTGDYIIDIPWLEYEHRRNGRQALMKDLAAELEQKAKITLALLERYETDFFMVVFAGPDRINHCLWQHIGLDPLIKLDAEGQEIQGMIHAYYRQLDDIVGSILKHAGADTSVLLISDHGFGPIRKQIYINKWLADQGFLASASNPRSAKVRTALRTLGRRLGITKDRWYQAMGARATKAAQDLLNPVRIDWSRTRAYSNGVNTIQINLEGREPYGIVSASSEYEEVRSQVMERLAELRDPETGRKVFKAVIPREKAGTGPNLNRAPDILLLMADEGYAAYERDVDVDHVFEAPGWRNGEHTLDGVLAAGGRHIKKGSTIVGATIMDLAPTILYRMGLPIPDDMDGRILTELFAEEFLGANTPLTATSFEQAADRDVSVGETAADGEAILERLRGLGYID